MAQIELDTQLPNNIVLKVGTDSYEKHVSNVNFTPSGGGAVTWQGGTPDAKAQGTAPSTWVANMTMVQALDQADSLINWCIEHEGEEVDIAWTPYAGGPTFYSTITVPPIVIGGSVTGASFNETTASCPCTKPSTTAPTA